LQTLKEIANTELKKICEFFRTNKLAIHPKKTQFMIFSNSPTIRTTRIDLNCDDNNENQSLPHLISPIQQIFDTDPVPAVRFLGVFFDPNLNFKFHINKIRSKIVRSLFILRSVRNIISENSLTQLYYTLIHCHLIYAIQIWSSTKLSFYGELFKLQKASIRIITNSKYNAHTEPLFKKCNILPLPDLINFFKVQFMHHFTQNFLPISFNYTWLRNSVRNLGENEIVLRNNNDLQIPFSRLKTTDQHPLISFPKIWENFPDIQIKFIRNKIEFDEKLKSFYLDDLSSIVNCNRLFCYSCSTSG
jgi:hypothetical protein